MAGAWKVSYHFTRGYSHYTYQLKTMFRGHFWPEFKTPRKNPSGNGQTCFKNSLSYFCAYPVTKANKTDQLSNSECALLWRKLKHLLIKVDKSMSKPEKCLSFHKEIPPAHLGWKRNENLKECLSISVDKEFCAFLVSGYISFGFVQS